MTGDLTLSRWSTMSGGTSGPTSPCGGLGADEVAELSEGLLEEPVEVRINRAVPDSDVTLIIGPVLPHEVVGFSGGNKYLFPGLSGQELIDVTHWLGALITSSAIIGTRGITPVRALIDAAARLVPGERHALCVVVDHDTGRLSRRRLRHTRESVGVGGRRLGDKACRVPRCPRCSRVLSMVATRYADLWTGAKGFYKVEPVVADGGEVVLYAPHIDQIAAMHPGLETLGYHCRDYFLAHWERYRNHPRGDLAHSTHLYGAGTYDPVRGEHQRVRVTLATGIPEDVVRRANLHYLDPGLDQPRRVVVRPRGAGRAGRRRGPLPAALSSSSLSGKDQADLRPDGVERAGQVQGLVE